MTQPKYGGLMCGCLNRRCFVSAGAVRKSISILEILAVKLAILTFTKKKQVKVMYHLTLKKKHDCTKSLAENGREGKGRGTREDFKRNLGISSTVGDHDYSRIFPNSLNVTPDSESKNVVESSQ